MGEGAQHMTTSSGKNIPLYQMVLAVIGMVFLPVAGGYAAAQVRMALNDQDDRVSHARIGEVERREAALELTIEHRLTSIETKIDEFILKQQVQSERRVSP